uniref:LOW QUALITY PROTEIN: RNA-binding motif protein, X-linked 2 n=1 Tax=Gasterosteus aculeatus aculeatus TaxID=481459 RepID=UPI001A99B1C9|nr:LOW QUALITY PROTEIN: RNA-binding motif protein, X-linked 2 [Gasterosteus aculeatus aculeatus]
MNPLTKVKLINELNEREANLGVKDSVSWHTEYSDSAWVFVGGFPYELTEGDIICVFSQYGEIVNINLVRDKKTGKSKGFCFICFEDQRSTILVVDNLNGIKIKGRTIRVDHVKDYRPPKDTEDMDDITKHLREQGCAPKTTGPPPSHSSSSEEERDGVPAKRIKKDKKEKKKRKKEKKKKKMKAAKEREGLDSSSLPPVRVKEEKEDAAYHKYDQRGAPLGRDERRDPCGDSREERGRHEVGRDRKERDRRWEGDRETGAERRWEGRKRETDREGDRRRETGGEREGDRKRNQDRVDDGRRDRPL